MVAAIPVHLARWVVTELPEKVTVPGHAEPSRRDRQPRNVLRVARKREQSLTPNADNAHSLALAPVNDAEWRFDDLSKNGVVELGNDPTAIRELAQRFDAVPELRDEVSTDIRRPLLFVVGDDLFEVADRRLGESNALRYLYEDVSTISRNSSIPSSW